MAAINLLTAEAKLGAMLAEIKPKYAQVGSVEGTNLKAVARVATLPPNITKKESHQAQTIAMRAQGQTQEQVAAMIGVDRSTLSDWENASIVDSHITSIPDLRLKIPKGSQEDIYHRYAGGEGQVGNTVGSKKPCIAN